MSSNTSRPRRVGIKPLLETLEGRAMLTGVLDAPPGGPPAADFDGDGRSDFSVFRPSSAQWLIRRSTEGNWNPAPVFGALKLADIPVAGDFDGDGKTEPAVFRVATAEWFAMGPNGGYKLGTFGAPNLEDIPVPADFDGDGKTDLAVFRHATGQWFMLGPTGGVSLGTFGGQNLMDLPVPGDYDGDGKAEPAVFRVASAEWFAKGAAGGVKLGTFGAPNLVDLPAPGDYDGDGKTEPAVFRLKTAEWFALGSQGGRSLGRYGGSNGLDFPVAAPTAALARVGLAYFPSVLSPSDLPFRRLDPAAVALHEAQVAQARTRANPVVLLGDSIFGRWGTPAGANPGRTSWETYLGPLGAANLGVSGDMTQDLLWRVKNGALAGQPRLAVVEIGTNNLAAGLDVNATVRGIAAVVSAIQAQSPDTEILILGVLPRSSDPNDPIRGRIADLNSRFGGLTSGNRVRFLDLGPYFLQADGSLSLALLPDGLHPSEQGYGLLGQLLRSAIDSMLAG